MIDDSYPKLRSINGSAVVPKTSFNEVFNRILAHKGETFHTITGLPFTYEIRGNIFYPSRTHYQISRSDFEKAYDMVPIKGPGIINDIVRGPTYIWAVLHDQRISLGEW